MTVCDVHHKLLVRRQRGAIGEILQRAADDVHAVLRRLAHRILQVLLVEDVLFWISD